MRVCFDTSVLVAALIHQHPHHRLAFPPLGEGASGEITGCLTTHGLAELFATLTALPLKPRLLAADAHNQAFVVWQQENCRVYGRACHHDCVIEAPLKVSTWIVQGVGWMGVIFFSGLAIVSWATGDGAVAPWFLVFVLLSLPLLLCTGPIVATPETLGAITPRGRFELRWDEIERVEEGSSSMVFFGKEGRRLSIPTWTFWSGPHRGDLMAIVQIILNERQIPRQPSIRADYLFSKKCGVDR